MPQRGISVMKPVILSPEGQVQLGGCSLPPSEPPDITDMKGDSDAISSGDLATEKIASEVQTAREAIDMAIVGEVFLPVIEEAGSTTR